MSSIAARWYIRDAERRSLNNRIEDASRDYRRTGNDADFAKLRSLVDQRDSSDGAARPSSPPETRQP